ncbi:MAG TPA: hypothetical protein VJB38_08590 [Bacteroidota bacterium]|nr:hypothetical protein [Bacteroidota bacterium]
MSARTTASSLLLVLMLSASIDAFSQSSAVQAGGSLNLSSEFYSARGVAARRPSNTYRGLFQLNVTFFDQIQLPFEAFYASGQTGFRQPFNQFGVSPRYEDWLVVHAGYYSARLSDLSFGDARLLGAGIELTPGPFRFSALYGRSDAAIQPDLLQGIPGTYRRTMWGGKVGYGGEDQLHLHLNFWHAIDDTTSLSLAPAGVAPQENFVTSVSFGVPIEGNLLTVGGEVAGSLHSNDIRSPEVQGKGIGHALFVHRTSSQLDAAAKLSVGVTPAPFVSVRLTTRWVGPGFLSLGYPQTPSDMFEWTAAPSFRLLDNALMIRLSFGQRQNNLRSNKQSTTRRTLWSLATSARVTNEFAVDFQYTNYGLRSAPKNDTLRFENISQSLNITPRYMFEAFGGASTLVVTYSLQDTEDKNVITSSLNRNNTQSVMGAWSVAFPTTLSLTTSILQTTSKLPTLSTSIVNVSETASHQFFDSALSASLNAGFSRISVLSRDDQFAFSVNLTYGFGAYGSVGFALYNNKYTYGAGSAGASFSEIQGTLSYSIGF